VSCAEGGTYLSYLVHWKDTPTYKAGKECPSPRVLWRVRKPEDATADRQVWGR